MVIIKTIIFINGKYQDIFVLKKIFVNRKTGINEEKSCGLKYEAYPFLVGAFSP